MKIQKKTVVDVEDVLGYLQGVVGLAKEGDTKAFDEGAYKYARDVLSAAEQSLAALGLLEKAKYAIDESERFAFASQFDEANSLLCNTAREMMEKSGTNNRLRKLYVSNIAEENNKN